MLVLNPSKNWQAPLNDLKNIGIKLASELSPSYDMSGMLYGTKSDSGGEWLMLAVPNALVLGAYDAIKYPGIELPPTHGDKSYKAHITVMNKEELESIGGLSAIRERGRRFDYNIGQLVSFNPAGWAEMKKCWAFKVHSPALQELRRSYGLSSLPNNGKYVFHITVAVMRRGATSR